MTSALCYPLLAIRLLTLNLIHSGSSSLSSYKRNEKQHSQSNVSCNWKPERFAFDDLTAPKGLGRDSLMSYTILKHSYNTFKAKIDMKDKLWCIFLSLYNNKFLIWRTCSLAWRRRWAILMILSRASYIVLQATPLNLRRLTWRAPFDDLYHIKHLFSTSE